MEEVKKNIEEHELYKLSSNKIKPEDLEVVLEKINNSDQAEWFKLQCVSRVYFHTKQYEKALEIIVNGSLVSKMPEEERWRACFNQACCLGHLQRPEEALGALDWVPVDSMPKDKQYLMYHLLGDIYFELKQYELSLYNYFLALESNPPANERWELHRNRVLCFCRMKHYIQALPELDKAINSNPPADMLWWFYDQRRLCYGYLEQLADALEAVNQALNADPPATELSLLYGDQAVLYCNLDQPRKALASCEKALANNLTPNLLFDLHSIQATCHCKLREYALGLLACEMAQKYEPRSAECTSRLQYWRGRCLLALGQVELALKCFAESDVKGCDFYRELCDNIIKNEGTVKDGILTLRL